MSNGNDHMDAATSSYERCNAGPSNDETYTTTSSRSPSELLSVAKRHYPRSSEDKIAEQAEILASKSDTEYGLAKISCEACYLRRSFDNSVRWFSVTSLSKDCDLCGILRKCQQHFANGCDAIELHARGSSNNLQICFPKSDCESNHVQLYCKESCMPQTPFRYAEDVHEFAESEASMSVMKKWISDCCTFHQHASPKRNSNPTRLIKLGRYEDDGARLYSPKHPVVFTALSYRWGLGKQSGTTKDNVTKRYQELNTSDFPKTLQDAIHITRRLGLEYIWIDRVCIIQDDKEDWANEASLMAGIYASAYVVLSATATEDCENGFLHKRQKPLLIRYAQHGQRSQKVYARRIESHLCHRMKPRTDYILHGRGWCMQERFLARRIIHFLPDEILFECQARRECECGAASNEDGDEFSQHGGSPEYGGYSNFARMQAAKSMEERELTINWARIVDRYSRMKLTYGKDSLPALSGIAACVQHLDPGKYIAGLWEKDIAIQLGWFIYPKDDLTRRWEDPKDINILGPTFSWSSHAISPVRYAYYHTARSFCALESFNIELATSNPYGQVRDATICLSGWSVSRYDMITLFRTPVVGFYDPCVYFDFGLQFEFDRHKKSLPRDKMIEELENTIGWESVMCFGLYEYHNPIMNTDQVDALLVQPSKTEVGKYVRIGVVLNLKKSWFKKTAVARTINLV